ncbi:hypothetical protein LTR37_003420 [Vermiconidia calcicola]|uniref:Uncharacterized protein n=1 Tax=Vermiconidia calcicola TaxID=1690605 RepID=A0ACC3NR98_9PEZI|nr:hypothetical protein LTR37_003420 [Vermiconidia calcicola]
MPLDVPFHGMNVTIDPAGSPTPGLPKHGWKVWISLVLMVIFSGLFVAVSTLDYTMTIQSSLSLMSKTLGPRYGHESQPTL